MIFSDRQYNVSRAELEKLRTALADYLSSPGTPDNWLRGIERAGLESQIADIEAEVAEYELLRSGKVSLSESSSLSDLPRVLVQARISKGLSQTELAEKLQMKPQQVQRYEATNYMSASLARLVEIADALDVKISEAFESQTEIASGAIFSWNNASDVAWSRLPINEMVKRGWFDVHPGQSRLDAVREFFFTAAGPQFASALHRKKVRGGNLPNEFGLLAWQAQILAIAKRESSNMPQFVLDDTWLGELVKLTRLKNGPRKAKDLLADHGVILVIERHLPGTYLDGAAMLSDSGHPVIALTLRYDRLDNFWFVLFHELGHVFLHLFDNLKFDFFDEESGTETDSIEAAADKFALEALIPESQWNRCLSRFALSEEAVRIDAKKLDIDASIIAGRIRKERNNYIILNNLVGLNSVRIQFETPQ